MADTSRLVTAVSYPWESFQIHDLARIGRGGHHFNINALRKSSISNWVLTFSPSLLQ